jgi:cellulose biosynthesis protein BcsQ
MTEQAPDDIFALYSRFDLDGENYRVFPRPEPAAKSAIATIAAPDLSRPSSVEGETLQTLHPRHTLAKPAESDASRAALQSLWRSVKPVHDARLNASAAALAAASVSIHGAAGGVGSTTIAAALTRLLAKSGRRCAIFDEAGDSTLPIFFGAQRIAEEHRRFSGLRALFEPRIRILNFEMFETAKTVAPVGPSFIERNFAGIAADFDHLIFDRRPRCADSVGAGVKLFVSVPDLSSLAGMRKLIQISETALPTAKGICVLNRFDSTNALHQEVHGWYRENFREVVVIHHSPLIPEALAEGTTVMDWAPDAPVSTDFLNLFAIVSRVLACAAEGSSLCS